MSATGRLEKQTQIKYKEHQTKWLCLESRLKSCSEEGACKAQGRAEWQGLILSAQSAFNSFFDTCACRGGNPKLQLSVGRRKESAVLTLLVSEGSLKPPLSAHPRQGRGSSSEKTQRTRGSADFCPLSPLSSAAAVLLHPQLQPEHKHPAWSLHTHHSELCALSDLYRSTKGEIISASPGEPLQEGWDARGIEGAGHQPHLHRILQP